ncbi:MAG TPA: hypothetical protein VMA72_19410, partial [Streptosporangiaceae bacterium]|nr:hypothetical protein [Streptosporangiaceae bacterium]
MEQAAPPGSRESADQQAQERAASGSGSDSPARPEAGLPGLLRRVPGWVVAAVLYAAGGVAMWWQVWSGHPSSTMTCACGDPSSFVWFLAWPA